MNNNNIPNNDTTSEDMFNVFRALFSDLSNVTMYDTYNDYLDNARNFNSRRSRYSNNYGSNTYDNTNYNTNYVNNFTNRDICNNMVFTVINEYNVNMLEYNINMREFFFRDSNNYSNNTTNSANAANTTNTNFIEYNNNISDYNSNIRRFLDLISSINYNNNHNTNNNNNHNTNNNRNNRHHRHNENIRENTRQHTRQYFSHSHNNLNIPNTTSSFGSNQTIFPPSQLFSYFLPNTPRTFTNVIVRPTERQITDATQLINYSENETYNNTSCPITMEEFDDGEQICQIKHCGHNFREDALRNWFRTNVRCPVCRYDIRDYIVTDPSNNISNIMEDVLTDDDNVTGFNNNNNNSFPTGFLNNNNNNNTVDGSNNNIPRINAASRPSNSRNLSNIIQSYVEQHITPFVEDLNSNLSDFDIILPVIYYNDTSGYSVDSSGSNTQQRS